MLKKKMLFVTSAVVLLSGFAMFVSADHSWGNYHWGRTASPFKLELGDNVSSAWDSYLSTTAVDWSVSSVLDTIVTAGKTNPRGCKAANGRVEVCSAAYGYTGWLGIAQIWISGGHIVKGVTKVNDTYFNTATYDKPEWRNFVMCQEVGHTLGLGHVDENFNNLNLGTCMDYTNDPARNDGAGDNQHPNAHDYEMLDTIYAHLDGVNTVGSSGGGSGAGKGKPASVGNNVEFDNPSEWGQAIKKDTQGRNSLYVRDLGRGEKLFTFVIWAR